MFARLFILWGVIDVAPQSQVSPFCALCVAAWAAVEVPRYALYLCDVTRASPPYALKWLRYSLFVVLYPAGIVGEVGCLLTAVAHVPRAYSLFLCAAALLYLPGAPTMVGHMWAMRKKKLAEGERAPPVTVTKFE